MVIGLIPMKRVNPIAISGLPPKKNWPDKHCQASVAGRGGFEPPVDTRPTTVFETVPFNHSGTFPGFPIR